MNGVQGLPDDFEWHSEYDELLEQISSTDVVDLEWSRLRDILKYKLNQNIADYLTNPRPQTPPRSPISNPALSPRTLTSGGLRLPPFQKREASDLTRNEFNAHGPPKITLTEDEAIALKNSIFGQLHEFDRAPFTIQRICGLALKPRQHYKYIGKYLRAFSKSLLVTSTHDAFPIPPPSDGTNAPNAPLTSLTSASTSSLREPTTPLFSPIPFLHTDARRRSVSHSPPLSPLTLSPALSDTSSLSTSTNGNGNGHSISEAVRRQLSPHTSDPTIAATAVSPLSALSSTAGSLADPPPLALTPAMGAIGLVDELDDPNASTGYMSDHPTALTSVTSSGRGPLHGSLEERFTSARLEVGGNSGVGGIIGGGGIDVGMVGMDDLVVIPDSEADPEGGLAMEGLIMNPSALVENDTNKNQEKEKEKETEKAKQDGKDKQDANEVEDMVLDPPEKKE